MPVVSFMPYFPDRQVDQVYGDFQVWNWHAHKARYISDQQTRTYLDRYFQIYRRPDGKIEDRVAIVSLRPEGFLLSKLNDLQRRSIGRFSAAAMLAHLAMLPSDPNGGMFASSSDNFVVLFQPFDVSSTTVALQFGSYFRAMWTASGFERLQFLTPQHVPDPGAGLQDNNLMSLMAAICSSGTAEAERIFRSLDWVRFAFTNESEHPYQARIVSMATAFEILLDIPDEPGKGKHFSKGLNHLIPPHKLPVSRRPVRRRSKKIDEDNDVGWWCRHFYELRSRIVHGDKLQAGDYMTNGEDDLKIALFLFVECIWGLLRRMAVLPELDYLSFWMRAHWVEMLRLPHDAFL